MLSQHCLTPFHKFRNYHLKTNLLFFNFNIATTDYPFYQSDTGLRRAIYDTLIHNNFSYIANAPFSEYLSVLSTFRFCMSPPGEGIDTHRTWECLMVGTIPIVIHSPIDILYEDLPVLLINKEDVNQITVEYLNEKYMEITNSNIKYNFDKLYTPYWKHEIQSVSVSLSVM
jgi:hypothetical protein